ncbi:MAG: hypothetical protein WC780_10710 [Lentimicrobiaceae bacterium]|jgi:hypothetical protein
MKTKNFFRLAVIMVSVIALTFTSCKKDDLNQGTTDPAALEQLAVDENDVEGIMNDAETDITSTLAGNSSGFKSTEGLPCNATIDSLANANDTITIYITYNGLTCNHRLNKTGKIEIKKRVGSIWSQAGTTVIFKYIDFTVTRVASGKSVTLNGTKTFVNVNGGCRWMVGTLITSYVERISGSIQASFDNSTSRTWNVARQVTFTGTPGQYNLSIDGFGVAGDYQNLVVWGSNRLGNEFYTQITQPVVCRQTCDWDPVSGTKVHQVPSENRSATITFGYDSDNQPIVGDDCPTRFRVDWQYNTNSGTSYLSL